MAESNCCSEFFVEPSTSLFTPNASFVTPTTARRFLSSDHRYGWFLVVRGMVRKVTRSEEKISHIYEVRLFELSMSWRQNAWYLGR